MDEIHIQLDRFRNKGLKIKGVSKAEGKWLKILSHLFTLIEIEIMGSKTLP